MCHLKHMADLSYILLFIYLFVGDSKNSCYRLKAVKQIFQKDF